VLQSVRSEGTKPPFFVVHGVHGTVPIAQLLGRALDHDQPLYILHARGIDGKEPPHERIEDILEGHLAEIRGARPHGPYVIGGMCVGSLVALELARTLAMQGERVGTAILVDPPLVPYYQVPANQGLNPKADPRVYQQLYAHSERILRRYANHFGDMPFDVNDPAQLHHAIDAAIATIVAFCRYVPPLFDGRTEFIISADRAFGHFHPEGPWKNIVAKPGRFHVIPGNHDEFFYVHLNEVIRLVQFALDSAFET
jgi:thioesterase domain-containing protein